MSIPVLDVDGPPEEEIAGYLARLDGEELFAVALWRLPDGFGVGTNEANRASDAAYLQSAGSADAMTIEWRRVIDGAGRQFAVGRDAADGEQIVAIPFGTHSLTAPSNEVFTAEEAAAERLRSARPPLWREA